MAVQFILGRSGSGKTTLCVRQIVEQLLKTDCEQKLILLVPEQATYQAERAILNSEGIEGYSRLQILSFERLNFLIGSRNNPQQQLSKIAKQMILHRLLRKNKTHLSLFTSATNAIGLSQQLEKTITELNKFAASPEDIDELVKILKNDG